MSDDVQWADVGERLRGARLAAGLSQEDLAVRVGLERTMIAKIESGSRRIDALELIRIASALQVPVDYLLRPAPPILSRRASLLAEDTGTDVTRESVRLEVALVAWLHDVQQLIGLNVLQPKHLLRTETPVDSSAAAARELALWVRGELEAGTEPIESLMELCERAGQYVLVTELPGDGASVVDDNVAAAVVSIRGDPGRRRATAAHELGHLVIGDEYSNDLGVHASRADREAVLDAFAAELLLPTQVLTGTGQADGITRDQLIELAARYRTSWSLAIRQADHAGVLTGEARRDWSRSTPTRAELMEAVGWVPQPDLESIRVPPGYAHAVVEAWRRGRITATRAVELMHGQITLADLPVGVAADVEP